MAVDESLDAHEAGLALVAARESIDCIDNFKTLCAHSTGKPFRESGPPQNMAQLIMLRHKVSVHHVCNQFDLLNSCQDASIQCTKTKERHAYTAIIANLQHHPQQTKSVVDEISKDIRGPIPLTVLRHSLPFIFYEFVTTTYILPSHYSFFIPSPYAIGVEHWPLCTQILYLSPC